MSKHIHKVLVAAAIGMMAGSAMAASDGTITVTGNVVGSTCKINGGVNDQTVPLPTVGTNTLSEAGKTAGRTPFSFSLTECATGDGAPTKVAVSFEPGPNVNLSTGRLVPTGVGSEGVASNVEIGFLNDQYQPIKIGSIFGQQNSQSVKIDSTSGSATLQYAAEYTATGVTTAGKTDTSVQYSLVYP